MIQRCKNCGNWVEAEERDAFDRAVNPVDEAFESEGGLMENIGGWFGFKGLGRAIDRAARLPYDIARGAADSVFGDKYHFSCPNCGEEWSTDNDREDETWEYEEEQRQINLVRNYRDKSITLVNAPENEKIRFVEELSTSLPSVSMEGVRATLFDTLAFSQFKLLGNVNEALNAIAESLKLIDDPNTHALRGVIMGEGRTPADKYKVLQELIYCKDPQKNESFFYTHQEYLAQLEFQNSNYAEHFLEIPQHKRKFLVIDDDLNYLPDSFKVLSINTIPTELQFPTGHPIEKQMYICHPLKSNVYLPIDDYQLELFRDEVKELCLLLQALGAKSISITDSRSNEKSLRQKRDLDIEAGGDIKTYSANIKGCLDLESEEYLKIRNEFVRKQEFTISSTIPCVPEGLVWYSHRADWQQMALQRCQGTLVHHHDYMSIQKNSLVNENEKKQLEADFKTLVAKGNSKIEMDKTKLFKENTDYTFELNVVFYPLSAYEKKKDLSLTVPISNDKKSYLLYFFGGIIIVLGIILFILFG